MTQIGATVTMRPPEQDQCHSEANQCDRDVPRKSLPDPKTSQTDRREPGFLAFECGGECDLGRSQVESPPSGSSRCRRPTTVVASSQRSEDMIAFWRPVVPSIGATIGFVRIRALARWIQYLPTLDSRAPADYDPVEDDA
jgi:hypothetical protein